MKIGEWNVNKKGGAFEYYFFILKSIIKQQKEGPCKLVLLL